MRQVRIAAVASVLLVAAGSVLALSGCGSDHDSRPGAARTTKAPAKVPFAKLPAAEIARRAIADMGKLRNFRAEVTVQQGRRVLQIDVRRSNGGACFGQMSQGGETARIIATEDQLFVRATAAFWRRNGSRDVIADMTRQPSKWARFEDSETHNVCEIPTLMDRLELDKKTLAGLRAKVPSLVQGFTAVTLANPDDSINVVVNADSPHYILEIRYEGEVRLSDFDVPVTVRIPRRGQFVPFLDSSMTV